MKRIIEQELLRWKDEQNRKPLLVRGARQVGKSHTIEQFGNEHFDGSVFIFNFERNPEHKEIFEFNLDPERILSRLELVVGKRITPGSDLLFFDEIQDCPKAISSLRYFYEEIPDLHVIGAGSLLEFGLQKISVPIGRLQSINMFPMNFIEFLWATDKSILVDHILSHQNTWSKTEMEIINRELEKYFLIGGMPECVKAFAQNGSFQQVVDIQTDLLTLFRQDFPKYVGHADRDCLNQVMDGVAKRIGKQIKYSHLTQEFSTTTIKKAFGLLELARLFSKTEAATPGGIPLGLETNPKFFKATYLDIGLLSNLNRYHHLTSKDAINAEFRGVLAEQFIGQELRVQFNDQIYYWKREKQGSSAEVDYLINYESEILPIEVKSGKKGRLTSLHLLLNSHPDIRRSIVFTEGGSGNIEQNKIQFLPLFAVSNITKIINPH